MLVRDIMTTPARRLRVGKSFEDAIDLLVDGRISSIPIVDESERVVGILTEADVLRCGLEPDPRASLIPRSAPSRPWPRTVEEAMTPDPWTAHPTADVADVAQLMGERGWKSLPVVDHDRLVAVVSRSDILRSLHTSDQDMARALISELSRAGHRDWTVSVALGAVSIVGPADDRQEHLARAVAGAQPGVRRVRVSQHLPSAHT